MPTANDMDKAALRARFRNMRLALAPDERARLSHSACEHVLYSEVWKRSARVGLYIAVRGETDASLLLHNAWESGKTVLLPLCSPSEKGVMRFVPCPGPEALRPGLFGIPEPIAPEGGASISAPTPPPPDLFIVPGVAFTVQAGQPKQLGRLGQGGGYYDRLLAAPEHARAFRMALAYAFQIVPELPVDDWDCPMHAIAMEKGIIWPS